MKKSVLFWLSFAFAFLIAVYIAVRVVMVMMGTLNVSPVGAVSIKSNSGGISHSQIVDAMGLTPKKSAYSEDLDSILDRILAIPEIEQAAVRRHPSGKIEVRIRQSRIVATWTDGAEYYPVSDAGRIISTKFEERPDGYIIFSGKLPDDITGIIASLKRVPGILKQIDRLEWIENRRLNIYTHDGIKIMLPQSDIDTALRNLAALDKNSAVLSRKISIIDMRDSARILVR
ncbi:MAG: cell division protein FtsQ/DivIB [Alphaproteobacteria bacterium]|nr:cell division protein FtsQ/DivIB [Alphaproteobacteria bacterium]MCL2890170.1 cell division protein FtsQ/DivIB [Alphaproteobacteria bacterium]